MAFGGDQLFAATVDQHNGGDAASVDTGASGVVQLSDNTQPTTVAAPATPVLEIKHLANPTIIDGTDATKSEIAHVPVAPANQNGTDPAAGPANEAAFGGDAAPVTNELAPASGAHALGGVALASAISDATFGGDNGAVSPATGEADAGALTNALHGGLGQSLLSSLLKVLTGGEQDTGAIQVSDGGIPGEPVLDSKHLTNSMTVDGQDVANNEAGHSTVQMVPANEAGHSTVQMVSANEHVLALSSAASPTLASATFGALGNDSFAFHPKSRQRYGAEHARPDERARP